MGPFVQVCSYEGGEDELEGAVEDKNEIIDSVPHMCQLRGCVIHASFERVKHSPAGVSQWWSLGL